MDEALRLIVVDAITNHHQTRGCFEWDGEEGERVRTQELGPLGLTLEGVRKLVIDHVSEGGRVDQRREHRPHWQDRRDYWYRVVVQGVDGVPRGLFVEMELTDDDPECPTVTIFNAHR